MRSDGDEIVLELVNFFEFFEKDGDLEEVEVIKKEESAEEAEGEEKAEEKSAEKQEEK